MCHKSDRKANHSVPNMTSTLPNDAYYITYVEHMYEKAKLDSECEHDIRNCGMSTQSFQNHHVK